MALKVGDHVRLRRFKWKEESDRIGIVVELYRGRKSAVSPGLEMVAVRWDDTGQTERGYILTSGTLVKIAAEPNQIGEA